jgi:hypothetical protein
VLTSVLGTRSAGLDEALLQRRPGSNHTHAGIADRQASLFREGFHGRALQSIASSASAYSGLSVPASRSMQAQICAGGSGCTGSRS